MKHGLVIRTAFNNQGWSGRCRGPLGDPRCFKCLEGKLWINHGNPIEEDEHGVCKGNHENYPLNHPLEGVEPHWCWEQVLCKRFFWGNVRGKWMSVSPGMPTYFVYPEPDGSLTLWGFTTVDKVDNTYDKYTPIYFKRFEPLPDDKWVRRLSGEEITGSSWRQGHYRYLDEKRERYLASLIQGNAKRQITSERPEGINVVLRQDIRAKLIQIAEAEGREVEDLIREAVARLIRERRL